jgi:cytochrome c-type biogenesis protein CcmH/NrfF
MASPDRALSPFVPSEVEGCDRNPLRIRPSTSLGNSVRWLAFLLLAIFAVPVAAQDSLPPAPYAYRQLEDPAKEKAAQDLMMTLRCLTCQSQSIADSDAPMAGDMRNQVRERIARGEDPEAIRAWLIERYGDWVSYEPRVTSMTWPLFAAPIVLLLLAAVIVRKRFTRARAQGDKS